MTDLKDYLPDEIIFKLPTTVKFPEVIFPDCICMDDVKKKLSEHFVTIQEKDVIANRVLIEMRMKNMNIPAFKYWLRIHGYRLEWFGTGTKSNPIKVKSKRK